MDGAVVIEREGFGAQQLDNARQQCVFDVEYACGQVFCRVFLEDWDRPLRDDGAAVVDLIDEMDRRTTDSCARREHCGMHMSAVHAGAAEGGEQ